MKRKHFMYLTMAALLLNSCTPKETNPFLTEYKTPYQVPPFNEIKIEHYLPAVETGFKQQIAEIETITNNSNEPDFKNTIEALELSGQILGKVNGVLYNLTSSDYTEELLAVSRQIAPLASQHEDNISMNPALFQKVKAVYEKRDALNLNTEQLKLVEETYKNFERGGANLSAEEQEKMKAINEELSLLSIKFRDNSNKDGNAFMLVLENEADLAGLPQGTLDAAAMSAKHHGMDGKWVVTLDNPSRIPFLQYSSRRDLREKVYSAYIQRGNNDNEFDNKEVLRRILSLRVKKANLLGFKTHADYVLEKRMARNPEEIFDLCEQLMERANIAAKKEVKELQKMITNSGEKFKLAPWDWWFYTEKLRKQRYDLDEEELRPYFELNNVRNGVFDVATKLYDITFKERTDIPT
ncbi:MAG: M3 family metallopeptidase, partial [Salinivirgaceae bacterium]|nr:M3 family metallopeptidase [Salinivirgaceae bacterium]